MLLRYTKHNPDMLMAGTFRVDETLLENALVKLSEGEWNFSSFICPPVTECTECHATLSVANRPSLCHVYTLSGPKPSTKITLRCRNCNIYYGCAMYSRHGIFHYYDPTVLDSGTEIMVIEASNMNYIEKKLYQWLPPLINHCFVSFEGFSVVYNEVYSEQVQKLFHTTVKVASSGSASGSATCAEFSDEFIDNFEEQADHEEQDVDGDPSLGAACSSGATSKSVLRHKAEKAHIPGKLHRKTVATAFWELELQKELEDLDLVQKWSFVKKKEQNSLDNNFTGTKEEAIEYIVQNRNTQTYTHECYEGCKSKGCDRLYVMDGNWKLAYAHCMFPVQVKIPGYEKEINYPNICPLSPQYQSAFCTKHHDIVVKKGMPTDLKTFIQYCANKKQDPDAIIKEAIVSDENAETVRSLEDDQCNAAAYQGTQSFMAENSALLDECTEVIKVNCNKDTVGKKRLQKWSRGIFIIASAGGHIDFWQPLYRSESPTQAFMITIVWLYNKFMKSKSEGKTDEELLKDIQATVLAYDNMCHLDTLRAAKKDLPLPKPFNTMWKDVRKV